MRKQKRNISSLVSVIVPVYNVENYLSKCIESLLQQTIENIEIIIVDDGSSDQSGLIADEYMEKFPEKIRTVHQVNRGLSAARNTGIKLAKGDYFGFVDSDDFVEPDMYSALYHVMEDKSCSIAYAPFLIEDENGTHVVGRLKGKITVKNVLENGSVSFCNKLFRKEVFEKWDKIPDMWYEDFAYVVPVLANQKSIGYVDKPLYHYIKRNDSIMGQIQDIKTLDMITAWNRALSLSPVEYHGIIKINILKRIPSILERYFLFWDIFVLKALEYWKQLSEIQRRQLDKSVKDYMKKLQKKTMIPTNIFIGGFQKSDFEKKVILEKKYKNVFYLESQIFFLDENNCDIEKNNIVKKKYLQKDWEWLSIYFALEKICELGGVYIALGLQITNYLDYLRRYESFWAEIKDGIISEKIFGGVINNEYFKLAMKQMECGKRIFNVFETKKENVFYDKIGIKVDSNNNAFLGLEDTVFDVGSYTSICTRVWENGTVEDAGRMFSALELLKEIGIGKYKMEMLKMRKRKEEIEASTSWKITEPIRNLVSKLE